MTSNSKVNLSRFRLVAALLAGATLLSAANDSDKRLISAAAALKEVMDMPDKSIPQDLLDKAECVVIVPDLKKAAFIIGGKYGKGFVTCRKKSGPGWSAPGAVRIEGGSFGFQIGGSEMDLFMLVMNDRGVERLLGDKFTLGADATVAAGPVGRTAQADTDARLTAEILTWSRSRGLFAGIALNGATLREDDDWTIEMYGKKLTNREVIGGSVAPPKAAATLLKELDRYSSRK